MTTSSAIIAAAWVVGVCVVVGGALVFFALLSNSRAHNRIAAALEERNKIEIRNGADQTEALRRGVLHDASQLIADAAREMRADIIELGTVLGAEPTVIAGKLEWRGTSNVSGLGTGGGVTTGAHARESRDRRRFDDVTSTMVHGIAPTTALGFEARTPGVTYQDLPRQLRTMQHPAQVAADQKLRQSLWEWALHWMRERDAPVTQDTRPWEPVPNEHYSWYDAFRVMVIQVYGFGLYADIRDQFPPLLDHKDYLEFRQRYGLDNPQ